MYFRSPLPFAGLPAQRATLILQQLLHCQDHGEHQPSDITSV